MTADSKLTCSQECADARGVIAHRLRVLLDAAFQDATFEPLIQLRFDEIEFLLEPFDRDGDFACGGLLLE